jgi:Cys-rich repeat protein
MSRGVLRLSFCLVWFGCGLDVQPRQLDEPCTRNGQCAAGLVCLAGVCELAADADPDAGVDGGVDGGADAGP